MSKFVCPVCRGKGLLKEETNETKLYHKCERCAGKGFVDKLQENET